MPTNYRQGYGGYSRNNLTPFNMPDPIAAEQAGTRVRGQRIQNEFAAQQLADVPRQRAMQIDREKWDRQAQALTAAISSGDPVVASGIYQKFGLAKPANFSFLPGNKIKVEFVDGMVIEGPSEEVKKLAQNLTPEQLQDPKMSTKIQAWMKVRGVSMYHTSTGKQSGGTERKVGSTREIKKGRNIVTQEWDGTKWNQLATSPRWQDTGAGAGAGDKPPDLIKLSKELDAILYEEGSGEPLEVDTSTKNRADDIAKSYGRTLNWEKTEDGWIVTGAMKSDTVAGAVTKSGRTAGKATNDPLGIR